MNYGVGTKIEPVQAAMQLFPAIIAAGAATPPVPFKEENYILII